VARGAAAQIAGNGVPLFKASVLKDQGGAKSERPRSTATVQRSALLAPSETASTEGRTPRLCFIRLRRPWSSSRGCT
jgi:hypothetical protein